MDAGGDRGQADHPRRAPAAPPRGPQRGGALRSRRARPVPHSRRRCAERRGHGRRRGVRTHRPPGARAARSRGQQPGQPWRERGVFRWHRRRHGPQQVCRRRSAHRLLRARWRRRRRRTRRVTSRAPRRGRSARTSPRRPRDGPAAAALPRPPVPGLRLIALWCGCGASLPVHLSAAGAPALAAAAALRLRQRLALWSRGRAPPHGHREPPF
mmetsp:Transcript_29301/g.85920  ORF Transcript_29301/g.85920 Transcript_29301/m.85920 type:complete len:212 (+) Transcript_29301:542-1177(+)